MRTARHSRPGLDVTEHTLQVPLDHSDPSGEQIEVFARELVAAGREPDGLPWLLWLQGGPGGRADRPAAVSGWLRRALREFRVLLLDQRGTGRSTPATRQSLPVRGDAAAQAAYLAHFRADAIIADAEAFRRHLAGEDARWSVLGQSFGGFCALTYLSTAPDGLREVLIAGGLPPLQGGPDPVYRSTYRRVRQNNVEYFTRYPDDERMARRVAEHLAVEDERLPTGERLSPRRLQSVGIGLGKKLSFDTLHYLLEDPFVTTRHGPRLSDSFLNGVWAQVSFVDRPLYAVLHEAIYCQGEASRWSAHRIRDEHPEFESDHGDGFRFTGEMIYPWQFSEDPALTPLADAAQLLAEKDDWPALYDPERLAGNQTPVAAAVYLDDMYVEFEHSMATARQVGALRAWVTNGYWHDGIREDGAAVLDRLIDMTRGRL
ncbi:MAG: alpha/beta fold hydrolase [Micromonosporaceae bacterium]